MWKQCAEGLSGKTCQTGSAHTFTWANALAYAEASTFANHADWRLPNVKELSTLVEDCRTSPAINTHRFPNTPGGAWSSSLYPYVAYSLNHSWSVNFHVGSVDGTPKDWELTVRLVRGGQ